MKYAINFLTTVFVGFPSLIAGYVWASAASGWATGKHVHERHELAAIERWVK